MRYLPEESFPSGRPCLRLLGARSIEELFQSIPEAFRLTKPLALPGPLSEAELIAFFRERAAENSLGYSSFLGAGVYSHLRSVVTDTILLRGEFLTSYTPYQAEISQGTLQAIFEFQTLMCELTGQEVANASMWDGSTAATEAVLMAERLTRRRRVLVARSLHPEYRQVLATYARNLDLQIEEIGFTTSGQIDTGALSSGNKGRHGSRAGAITQFLWCDRTGCADCADRAWSRSAGRCRHRRSCLSRHRAASGGSARTSWPWRRRASACPRVTAVLTQA